MAPEPDRIPLAAVDPARPEHRITTADGTADLVGSIAHVGLLAPPILLPEGNRFQIVAGNRRIAALRELGRTETPARLLPPDVSSLDRARIAVGDNSFQRTLNPVEQSRGLRAIAAHFSDPAALADEAGRLNLPSHSALIQKLLPLAGLPEKIQSALLADALALAMALELAAFPEDAQSALVDLFLELGLSFSRQREFLALLDEIAAREDRTITEVLAEPEIRLLLDDPEMDRPRKAGEVRRLLRRRRFPAITAAEERYAAIVSNLPLGKGIQLTPPRDFEGTEYVLKIKFNNQEELKQMDSKLKILINEFNKKIFNY
ncbi:MAG: ParB/RepB/Spo0J family partition protein [Desulfococcaceae bacterium]